MVDCAELEALGYHEAELPPSDHRRQCDDVILVAQSDDDFTSTFLYCETCRRYWVANANKAALRSEQVMFASAERLYSGES